MSGRLMIVESIATNRIALRSALEAAHYTVFCCSSVAEARGQMAAFAPDAILLDIGTTAAAALGFCSEVTGTCGPAAGRRNAPSWDCASKSDIKTLKPRGAAIYAPVPVIAMVEPGRNAARLAALRAGATDVFEKPTNRPVLLARLRSLLRLRDAAAELRPRAEMQMALGFAEEGTEFGHSRRIVVLTRRPKALGPALNEVAEGKDFTIDLQPPSADFPDIDAGQDPDLFIIDSVAGGLGPGDLFRLLADLRSRSPLRHAAQLVILPEDAPDLAAMSLDLGANDLVTDQVSSAELAHRIEALLKHKIAFDQLRASVKSGLEAAITDPLTGLYNRRYALSQLSRMAADVSRTGRSFAAMVIDIDHFKLINDRHGHIVGDRVLINVAQRLRETLRSGDFVARIGGEEFLVAMGNTTQEDARHLAEKLRRAISDTSFDVTSLESTTNKLSKINVPVTISVGVAMGSEDCQSEAGISELYARADAALYAAKTAGRNMVTLSSTAA
ncbi:response regulator [Flavimaricola marinus]|uniref:diguanylate cyclase n=1 Tax=Flavimaricola marinus TaxID=1819565 RepID=A0A238LGQ6_9RHOB|nr:response regulator [Flavimaricola marinus]SMY08752.1 Response regulator PleD [Flavimaricola marinus]